MCMYCIYCPCDTHQNLLHQSPNEYLYRQNSDYFAPLGCMFHSVPKWNETEWNKDDMVGNHMHNY